MTEHRYDKDRIIAILVLLGFCLLLSTPLWAASPLVRWAPSSEDCKGAPLTPAGYNVYAAPGSTFPTIPSSDPTCPGNFPSGVATLNGTALVVCAKFPCTFQTSLPPGTYTIAVTAVDTAGNESVISNTLVTTVSARPAPPSAVTIQ